ncbi:MAG: endo alpha-1,4 polygalactosaminidase [Candidatus Gracilibacteria bacterium]|nr:endo alpha-1,4 polygalactosaminidase [Candidatus Gracilibacteria bacterium]
MDTYDNFNEVGFQIYKGNMEDYLIWLNKEVNKRGMFLIQKNAPELSPRMEKYFDGALLEGAFYNNFKNNFTNYIKNKKIVFNVEYTDNTSKKEFLENICPKSEKLGFISILKNRNLDEFVVTCNKDIIKKEFTKYGNKEYKLTKKEIKIHKLLEKFYIKLDNKYLDNYTAKINFLEAINLKIKKLKFKNKKNKKLLNILNYVEYKISDRIFWYNYQSFEKSLEMNNSKNSNLKKLLPPKNGKKYFGAFQGFGGGETNVSKQKLEKFKKIVDKNPAWAYFSQDFAEEGIRYPKENIKNIIDSGEIPFIRLMPSMVYENNKKEYNLEKISSGVFDDEFKKWAKEAKKEKSPLLIDFAVEMNGDWFFYSGKPKLYKKAYRRIIDIFREEGVQNVTWFFHPNLQTVPYESWNLPKNYYPGDDYIDWIGVSLYGTQNPVEENIDFENTLKEFHKDILDISDKKPFALLEFGVADFNPNYKKDIWVKNTFETILSDKYINFSAISIWSEKWEEEDYYSDLRINSSKKSLNMYNKYFKNDIFINKLNFSNNKNLIK